jgi:heme/copper-type cytochrome/quinol oxidase subunit 1
MRKIENILLLPVLVLIVLLFLTGDATLDFHLHDTYFVIALAHVIKWFLYWLMVAYILYTVIRYRHKRVNTAWAITHISLTIIPIVLIWYLAVPPDLKLSDDHAYLAYEQAFHRKWEWRYLWLGILGMGFLLNQIVFLVYFVTRLFQTPDLQ